MKTHAYLNERGIAHEIVMHKPTYTAQRLAEAVHVSGDDVAKTVLLNADEEYVVAVLQAPCKIDLGLVRKALGAEVVDFVDEETFAELLPDCEVGAVPPFGSQYEMKTLVDEPLTKDESILFEGNSHDEAIRMRYEDFARLEKPLVANFSYHP